MSFFKVNKQSIYLAIDNQPKLIRPLYRQPEGMWTRNIPACFTTGPDGKKKALRFFRSLDANFSNWMKDNPDPLWDKLDTNDKHKQNGDRVDFPIRLVHIMPFWSYADEDIKVAKQGQQFYEEMSKFHDAGGDITTCDWGAWTEGESRRKKYLISRQDSTPWQAVMDPQILQIKCQELVQQALSDLVPFKTEEEMIKFITGQQQEEATSFPHGANQTQVQVPAYTPGGQSPMALGAPAALPPAQQPPAAQPSVPVQQPNVVPGVVPQTVTNQPIPNTAPQTVTGGVPIQQPGTYIPTAQPVATMPQQQMPQPQQASMPQQQWSPPPSQPQVQQPAQTLPQEDPNKVPNAPVTTQPTFAPPVQQPAQPQPQPQPQAQPVIPQNNNSAITGTGGPGSTIVDFGKYSGKTLAWIYEEQKDYLTFLKGKKKEWAAEIDQLLSGAATPPQPQQNAATVADETQRVSLVQQVNDKLMNISEFQGPAIGKVMMPWIESVIGTADFSAAPIDQLVKLNTAIDQRASGQIGE